MSKNAQDPGFGQKYADATRRIINKDGSFNVIREGTVLGYKNLYDNLINMRVSYFLLWIAAIYFSANLFFGMLFMINGVENLTGRETFGIWDAFMKCSFFSIQTFTTVGYGAISPQGNGANLLSALVALTGSVYFALVTGLIYGRFSKPVSKLIFSKKAIIAPFNDGKALMFRLANRRPNVLMNMHAEVLLIMQEKDGEVQRRTFYNLDLQLERIQFLPLSWTVVHPITEDSPLHNVSFEEMKRRGAEVLILISGFDDTFNHEVHARFSYVTSEMEYGARFEPAFNINQSGEVKMDIQDIHKFEKIDL